MCLQGKRGQQNKSSRLRQNNDNVANMVGKWGFWLLEHVGDAIAPYR
jgi:hypothetical protein